MRPPCGALKAVFRRMLLNGLAGCPGFEQRARCAQVCALVLRVEAVDEAGEPLPRRPRTEPTQAGRGAELEEQGLSLGRDRQRPFEVLRRAGPAVAGRIARKEALALQPIQLVLVDAF